MKRVIDIEKISSEPQKVTPRRVYAILKKYDKNVTIEQAEQVLDFLEKLAKLAFEQYME